MSTAKKILDRLSGVKETKSGWMARCPAHDDGTPSLSISDGEGGRVLLKCYAGCSTKEIVEALGLAERDLFDAAASRQTPTKASTPKAGKAYATDNDALKAYERTLGRLIATMPPGRKWSYSNADHKHVGSVYRWNNPDGTKRAIRPTSLHADGWRQEAMPTPRPLFNLCDWISEPGRVFVVEGEKAAEAIHGLSGSREGGLGLLVTTSAGGSSSAKQSDWTPLAGRDVVILPDADEPGRKYAAEVAEILLALDPPAIVRIVELAPDADDGSDVADLVKACNPLGRDLEALRRRIDRLVDETEPLASRPTKAAATTKAATPARPKIEEYEPLPVDALPDAAAELIIDAAKAIGCDEAFVAMPLLAVLGSAIGTTRQVEPKPGWRRWPIVWTVIVAESGSKKSPGADVTLDLVRDREAQLHEEYVERLVEYEAELDRYERAKAAWRSQKPKGGQGDDDDPPRRPTPPVARSVWVDDTTTEALAVAMSENPRGLILAADELNSWLAGMDRYAGKGGVDEAFFCKSHTGRSHNVKRKGGGRLHVRSTALWLTGVLPPGVLRRSLGRAQKESGLAARILMAAPPRRPAKWTEETVSPIVRENFRRVVETLYELQPEADGRGRESPVVVPFDYEAKKLWVDFYDSHNEEAESLVGDLLAAWSKLEESAARLALIIHETKVASGQAKPGMIDADSMRRALRLTAWFKRETRRVYALLAETELDQAIRQADDRLAAWVARRGGTVTPRDVLTGCRWIETSDDAEASLNQLVDAGRGRWEDRPPGEKGGRPTRLFVLAASAQLHDTRPKASFADADSADAPLTKGVVEL